MRSSNLLRQETERRTELTFPEPMCRTRCADSKKVLYVGVGPLKVGQKRTELALANAK